MANKAHFNYGRSPDLEMARALGLPGQNPSRSIKRIGGAETVNNMGPEARDFMLGLVKKSVKLALKQGTGPANERD